MIIFSTGTASLSWQWQSGSQMHNYGIVTVWVKAQTEREQDSMRRFLNKRQLVNSVRLTSQLLYQGRQKHPIWITYDSLWAGATDRHAHARAQACTHAPTHIDSHARTHTHAHTHTHTHARTHARTHLYIYTHKHTHTHIRRNKTLRWSNLPNRDTGLGSRGEE